MSATRPRRPAWVSLSSEGFQQLLAAPAVAKTTHFALHGKPSSSVVRELPTADAPDRHQSVDKSIDARFSLGLLVPKRHAKRAVTRNLIRRQMREAVRRHQVALQGTDWMIRLRSPFDPRRFPSAASARLSAAVRAELDALMSDATTVQAAR